MALFPKKLPRAAVPDVTYADDDVFVFCIAQDCSGTRENVDTANVSSDDGEISGASTASIWPNTCPVYEYWYLVNR